MRLLADILLYRTPVRFRIQESNPRPPSGTNGYLIGIKFADDDIAARPISEAVLFGQFHSSHGRT